MLDFKIDPVDKGIGYLIQDNINNKTKPLGSLGYLESLALKIGTIQGSTSPSLTKPNILVFAGDHGAAKHGVSAFPPEVTHQMVFNFLQEGAAINVFCKQNNIDLKIIDAGVNFDFDHNPRLINAKVAYGTKSYTEEPAMTQEQCENAVEQGAELVEELTSTGCNIVGFGEMGIGNTSSASLIMSHICKLPISDCIGRGTGLSDTQLRKKQTILENASKMHSVLSPLQAMQVFGGLEMTMMLGAMLQSAASGKVIIVDGFIATAVFLVAYMMFPSIMDYAIFSHQSDEAGHKKMLHWLQADPILNLGLRLGEGTGCALAYPLIASSVAFLNNMSSFESAGVSESL